MSAKKAPPRTLVNEPSTKLDFDFRIGELTAIVSVFRDKLTAMTNTLQLRLTALEKIVHEQSLGPNPTGRRWIVVEDDSDLIDEDPPQHDDAVALLESVVAELSDTRARADELLQLEALLIAGVRAQAIIAADATPTTAELIRLLRVML